MRMCNICGKPIEPWHEYEMVRPRGRSGGSNLYHKACIEAESLNRIQKLNTKKEVTR